MGKTLRAPIFAVATLSFGFTHGQVLSLATSRVCEISVAGVKLSDATVIGHEQDMRTLFLQYAQIKYHDCEYLLMPHPDNQSELDWIVERKATRVPADSPFRSLPKGHVVFVLSKPEEFATVLRTLLKSALQVAQPATAAPPVSQPPPPPLPNGPSKTSGGSSQKLGGSGECGELEFCITHRGEASFEVSCGPIKMKVTTEAKVEVGIKNDRGQVSIDLP